jgi:hypothetical protein
MSTWFEERFRDAARARETIAFVGLIGAGVGTIFLVLGIVLYFRGS